MRGRRRERLRVESRVHDTNLRSVGEQNRCQVGPTILFECPAQIPRSFLRSFSLWADLERGTEGVRPSLLHAKKRLFAFCLLRAARTLVWNQRWRHELRSLQRPIDLERDC